MPQRYQPPPYPPPDWHPQGRTPQYAPPPGPPPDYTGPQQSHVTFTSSSTPSTSTTSTAPQNPHNWQSIPDTSLLPPPPALQNDHSPTANASASEGEKAFRWCLANPLHRPVPLTPSQSAATRAGDVDLLPPANFAGSVSSIHRGRLVVRSNAGCQDSCLQTALPLYSALVDSPLRTGSERTVYFELKVLGVGEETFEEAEAGVAIGFLARPFPEWRLPGWQRGSLGVHGDDGRRYVNDDFGGTDFTTSFRKGETVGLGMRFTPPPPAYDDGGGVGQGGMDVEIFFTREGKKVEGWDLHEEMDERKEGGVVGLEGEMDLFGAVGVFGAVEVEVVLRREEWLWKG
ncbi:hypothetical protein K490DRAFT_33671 [Saccharata proteae CBS 121410]|uniref:SPRY domain-containing protein n=1 Tax=Saccharata proteae CBS 121410 TaxID=1314787 RepID=A0A9P4HY06_9PEZI|nr:hypothetical protein K490DRAFT_33671 [Saccharata proteae CBS 121410]